MHGKEAGKEVFLCLSEEQGSWVLSAPAAHEGAEKMTHVLRCCIEEHCMDNGFVVLKVDMRNAFNIISRQAVLNEHATFLVLWDPSSAMAPSWPDQLWVWSAARWPLRSLVVCLGSPEDGIEPGCGWCIECGTWMMEPCLVATQVYFVPCTWLKSWVQQLASMWTWPSACGASNSVGRATPCSHLLWGAFSCLIWTSLVHQLWTICTASSLFPASVLSPGHCCQYPGRCYTSAYVWEASAGWSILPYLVWL